MKVRIGTRASELALRQSAIVQQALARQNVDVELVKIKTLGDKKLDQPLPSIGGKGLFTHELELALRKKKIDLCVHSLKDLPTEVAAGTRIGAMLEREDPRDVLVVNEMINAESLAELPPGCRVGTSSLRRRSLLLSTRSDVEVAELRGNVPTRIKKVDAGVVHAAILAAAGIHRLEARQRIRCYLEIPHWLPAAGQGIIAVQIRDDDAEIAELLAPLHDNTSAIAAACERAFLQGMDGGCQVPIGALCVATGNQFTLHGFIGDELGATVVRAEVKVDRNSPADSGRDLASQMRFPGSVADSLVRHLRELRSVPPPQPE